MSQDNVRREIEELQDEILAKKKRLAQLKRNALNEEVEDYLFKDWYGNSLKLSELFGDKKDLILIHNMGKGCRYCTLWADGFNGIYPHLQSRAAFVLSSPDDPELQQEFANGRGWKFKIVSCRDTSFARDMGFQDENGHYLPGYSVFSKTEEGRLIRHSMDWFGPGDDYCSVWHFFDLLKDGVNDWEPQYCY
ncbi:MAG: DUF899 domain-containing protein [candidate division Zixibacteria bacterium]|nr:DUF899 domain-containing protein [candidate division Zixibacteria bacterium]